MTGNYEYQNLGCNLQPSVEYQNTILDDVIPILILVQETSFLIYSPAIMSLSIHVVSSNSYKPHRISVVSGLIMSIPTHSIKVCLYGVRLSFPSTLLKKQRRIDLPQQLEKREGEAQTSFRSTFECCAEKTLANRRWEMTSGSTTVRIHPPAQNRNPAAWSKF